jgi:hypothetical protein
MDLREIEEGISKEKENEFTRYFSAQRTEEIRRWLNFLKDAGKINFLNDNLYQNPFPAIYSQ